MKKLQWLFVSTFILFAATTAHAQPDPGENGANRRVETPAGYGGVLGNFSEPKFNQKFNKVQERHIDLPQMYLGVRGGFEVDAGLGWIPRINFNPTTHRYKPNNDPYHWYGFVRVHGASSYTTIKYKGKRWLVNRGALKTAKVQMMVRGAGDGTNHVHLSVTHNGVSMPVNVQIATPSNGQATALAMKSKRVTALTQRNGAYLDGAYMTGTKFSGGRVRKIRFNATEGTFEGSGEWTDWNEVKGDADHFYPWGRYSEPPRTGPYTLTVRDASWPWVIDCSSPHQRYKSGNLVGKAKNRSTLFKEETVNINMSKAVPPKAKKVKNAKE